ncbi:MAG: LysR family transcriptional regulator [Alphaproteobacteria bacterium HGW-Alphaproteobacteria-7]|jgi:putative oxidoreductase|nr:MAG: LysR family transcriptional regulator [Alphaproteobacteria bacterium HGW-Alphaproteobacteria-7]PKP86087.1 MAG: LysR family transcriptional regulator [Alphaproteobacteria bacterium HGW-Alphaproteobacteria-16]
MTNHTNTAAPVFGFLPQDAVALVARLLLAAIFLIAGVGKIATIEATTGYIASMGLPFANVITYATIALEVGGAVLLIAGYQTRAAAAALGLFSIAAAIIFHADFADQMQFTSFLKNLAIAGGMFQVVGFGPGRFSMDRG